jgi:hypothetical protein
MSLQATWSTLSGLSGSTLNFDVPAGVTSQGLCNNVSLYVDVTQAQEQENLLMYGIAGSEHLVPGRPSFSLTMRHIEVQKLLLEVAASPRSASYIAATLSPSGVSLRDLEKLRLVRRRDGEYAIGFTLLTKSDVQKVRAVAEEHARSLTAAFLERRREIDAALKLYSLKDVDPKAVSYIILGCFSLDWDGLDLTAKKGYRSAAPEQSERGSYIPRAEERSGTTLRGLFWGSHNADYFGRDFIFTSFGDHHSLPRCALPDLFEGLSYNLAQARMTDEVKQKLRETLRVSVGGTARRLAGVTFALRKGEQKLDELSKAARTSLAETEDLLSFLTDLDYVGEGGGRYHSRIPVLVEGDLAMVRRLRRVGLRVMDRWLAANYAHVEHQLQGIMPVRYGVPYADCFTHIWHYVFGTANRQLVEEGMFADPYEHGRKYKGFVPTVWHPSLSDAQLWKASRHTKQKAGLRARRRGAPRR